MFCQDLLNHRRQPIGYWKICAASASVLTEVINDVTRRQRKWSYHGQTGLAYSSLSDEGRLLRVERLVSIGLLRSFSSGKYQHFSLTSEPLNLS